MHSSQFPFVLWLCLQPFSISASAHAFNDMTSANSKLFALANHALRGVIQAEHAAHGVTNARLLAGRFDTFVWDAQTKSSPEPPPIHT